MPVADPGEGPGGPTTPLLALYSNQTEAKKIFWETRHPTPYQRVGMTGPPPPFSFSQSLDLALHVHLTFFSFG